MGPFIIIYFNVGYLMAVIVLGFYYNCFTALATSSGYLFHLYLSTRVGIYCGDISWLSISFYFYGCLSRLEILSNVNTTTHPISYRITTNHNKISTKVTTNHTIRYQNHRIGGVSIKCFDKM